MKIMAIDYGSKRVGIASTDDFGHFALPRKVLENNDELVDKILKFKEENRIEKIVLGESKNLDGTPNPIQEEINKLRNTLEGYGVEVVMQPEMFTTREAERIQGETNMTDASAAALILQSYLEKSV